ncbi:hypothetical protein ACP275_10G103700 [Erythranthe tilingii]
MIPSRQFFKLGVAYIPLFGSEVSLKFSFRRIITRNFELCDLCYLYILQILFFDSKLTQQFHLLLLFNILFICWIKSRNFFAYGFQRLSRGAGDSLRFSCNFLFFVFTQSNFITFFIRNHCFLSSLFLRVFYIQLQVSPFLVFRLRFAVALSVRTQVCRLFKNYIDVFQ